MFSRFFVAIGGIFMAIIEFIRNPSFGNSKIDSPIFSRLKIQKESRNPLQDETKLDMLKTSC